LSRGSGALTWTCPICDRRVPRRESECFCGAKRERAQQQLAREAERSPRRVPLDVAALLLALVLVGVYGVHRLTRPAEDDAFAQATQRALGGAFATPEPGLSQAPVAKARPAAQTAAPSASVAEVREPMRFPPSSEAPSPAPGLLERAPAPSPTPSPDEREQKRLTGISNYETELGRLTPLAARLAEHVRVFKTECIGGGQRFRYALLNCEEIESSIKRSATDIEQGLDTAEDVARRYWVEPGAVRDVRSRSFFGSRDWDDLLRSARDPRKP